MSEELPYVLTAHAVTVIAERKIRSEWLEQVLTKPDRIARDGKSPELRHAPVRIPEQGGRVLRVIYDATTEPKRIITAYFHRRERSQP